MNLAYNVGARDEEPGMTGFAHLFEHLMFGGSVNIPEFDTPLQKVGGENNAYTTSDYTNYYMTLPASNLETGFWLESDRMLSLSFSPGVLETQKKVVIEEFKQRYINRPYGDIWHKLRPVAYSTHPYRWPVIGSEISHVENADMENVRSFFFTHYNPDNAVLVVAGDVDPDNIFEMSDKWFGPIDRQTDYKRNLPEEPAQTKKREVIVEADVPQNALYKVYHIPGRGQNGYRAVDLLSDLLGRGKSSRLHDKLVQKKQVFTTVGANVTGTLDPGLLVIQGFLKDGIDFGDAERLVDGVIAEVRDEIVTEPEYNKIINQAVSSLAFSRVELLSRATAIAYGHLLGNPDYANKELDLIRSVSRESVCEAAGKYLIPENSTTLQYHRKKS